MVEGTRFMAVRKILTLSKYEKLLRTPSQPVKKIDREIKILMQDIIDTIDANPAVGLAAPQIGVLKRVIGVRLSYEKDQAKEELRPAMIMINPEILWESEEVENDYDACLSIPGMMAYTDRKLRIKVRYQDEKGTKVEREFSGWDARVIQHEVDHLNGRLFLDLLKDYENLFVLVEDKDGKIQHIPYTQIVANTENKISDKMIPTLPK
jgi:peptide deformylase